MSAPSVTRRLLCWYDRARRDLPWRRTRDPYAVWVSEVMLQQTQVATVLGHYRRWMQRFPDVRALAAAEEADVLHAWQGLGYYSRARSLLSGARAVVERHGGRLPDEVAALRALPGIGPYSAGAIASIAFGKREPVVDGNVKRVLCRLHALRGDPSRAPLAGALWELARELVPDDRPGDLNQALMELGATICTPRAPRCDACPIADTCRARGEGSAGELPELPRRQPPERVRMVAAVICRARRVLVSRLPDAAPRWAGMWQFPNVELGSREQPDAGAARAAEQWTGLAVEVSGRVAVVRHAVTRFRITLDAYRCRAVRGRARALGCDAVSWRRPAELDQLALPSAHRRLADRLAEALGG